MAHNNSPLEHLVAFAFVFAAGVLSSVGLRLYVEKMKKDAARVREVNRPAP